MTASLSWSAWRFKVPYSKFSVSSVRKYVSPVTLVCRWIFLCCSYIPAYLDALYRLPLKSSITKTYWCYRTLPMHTNNKHCTRNEILDLCAHHNHKQQHCQRKRVLSKTKWPSSIAHRCTTQRSTGSGKYNQKTYLGSFAATVRMWARPEGPEPSLR